MTSKPYLSLLNPRRDWDNVSTMACFHRRYDLGDDLPYKSPEQFWQHSLREHVPEAEILRAAKSGEIVGITLKPNMERAESLDIYEDGDLVYEGVPEKLAVDYLMEDLTVPDCMTLLEPYAEWLPLWLYEHSGISMSAGTRSYPYNDRWDSGGVGWIICFKDKFLQETGCPEDIWKERAITMMEADVACYDAYLRGEAYGYTLYEAEPSDEPDWTEIESCWGFIGSNQSESGLLDEIGFGLREALDADKVTVGTAQIHRTTYYVF